MNVRTLLEIDGAAALFAAEWRAKGSAGSVDWWDLSHEYQLERRACMSAAIDAILSRLQESADEWTTPQHLIDAVST